MRLQYNYNDSCSANLYLIKIQFLAMLSNKKKNKKNRKLSSTNYLGYLRCSPKNSPPVIHQDVWSTSPTLENVFTIHGITEIISATHQQLLLF